MFCSETVMSALVRRVVRQNRARYTYRKPHIGGVRRGRKRRTSRSRRKKSHRCKTSHPSSEHNPVHGGCVVRTATGAASCTAATAGTRCEGRGRESPGMAPPSRPVMSVKSICHRGRHSGDPRADLNRFGGGIPLVHRHQKIDRAENKYKMMRASSWFPPGRRRSGRQQRSSLMVISFARSSARNA